MYAADESYGEGITHVLSVNINALSPNVTLVATVGFLSRDPQGLALPWTNGSLTGMTLDNQEGLECPQRLE